MIKWLKNKIIWFLLGGVALAEVVVILPLEPSFVSEIEILQNIYFQRHGTYLQILLNNELPSQFKQTDNVKNLLSKEIPINVKIDVYGNKQGQGYQIIWEDTDGIYSKGYGNEAESRTWTKIKENFISSTSTPQ